MPAHLGNRAVPSGVPAEKMRLGLSRFRGQEWGFASAWRASMVIALSGLSARERTQWRQVLEGTRPAWKAAYVRARHPLPGGDLLEAVASGTHGVRRDVELIA